MTTCYGQVRFGILEAGAFGVPQARKRAFIWAASPEEVLPDWPEPMYVFAGSELKITLSRNLQYAAVKSTACGAPFRALTVRDTIGDLPAVGNGASNTNIEVLKLLYNLHDLRWRWFLWVFYDISMTVSYKEERKN